MNLEKIYAYRFQGVSPEKKEIAWSEIAKFIHRRVGSPKRVLEPACGDCEFLRFVDAEEKVGLDLRAPKIDLKKHHIQFLEGDLFTYNFPKGHFELAFLSNLLEHLESPDQVAELLGRLRETLSPGGKIVILGPNFKYAYREYFDCADHRIALSHLAIEELLVSEGFKIVESIPRFLPYSFRGRLPVSRALIALYLRMPFAWRILGKQFLIVASR